MWGQYKDLWNKSSHWLNEIPFIIRVDIFRMDGVSRIWVRHLYSSKSINVTFRSAFASQKRMGTTCENLPEAHKLIRAYNAICRISAPSILFQSEPISQPAHVLSYIDANECQLSYNPLEMSLGWEALATRNTGMLQQALERWHNLGNPDKCHWVNYVRSHEVSMCVQAFEQTIR